MEKNGYEETRLKNIQRNKELLKNLKLNESVFDLKSSTKVEKKTKKEQVTEKRKSLRISLQKSQPDYTFNNYYQKLRKDTDDSRQLQLNTQGAL